MEQASKDDDVEDKGIIVQKKDLGLAYLLTSMDISCKSIG